jgi:hypothetical protein
MSLLLAALLGAMQPTTTPPPVRRMTFEEVERVNIGMALDAVYAVISGPAGQKRDWAKMKTLFTPDARLHSIGTRGLSGGSLDDYIARSGPQLEKMGFSEKELTRRVEVYGGIAQACSSYAGTSSDGSVNVRGINSFQLVRQSDGRWLVHSILWQAERPGLPLPADMEAR